jgi:hypothetical protein
MFFIIQLNYHTLWNFLPNLWGRESHTHGSSYLSCPFLVLTWYIYQFISLPTPPVLKAGYVFWSFVLTCSIPGVCKYRVEPEWMTVELLDGCLLIWRAFVISATNNLALFVILGFELSAFYLLDRLSTTRATPPVHNLAFEVWKIRSHKEATFIYRNGGRDKWR